MAAKTMLGKSVGTPMNVSAITAPKPPRSFDDCASSAFSEPGWATAALILADVRAGEAERRVLMRGRISAGIVGGLTAKAHASTTGSAGNIQQYARVSA